jgi:hypothetical protein
VISRFEARWVVEEECGERIKNQWEQAVGLEGRSVKGGLQAVLGDLVGWSKEVMGDLDKRIKKLKKELEQCRREAISDKQVRKEGLLRFKLSRLEDQKDLYWRQRAHVHWMHEGDRNTKFFHSMATGRKKKNKIKELRREDGVVVKEEEELQEVATNYFLNLFASTIGTRTAELMVRIDPCVTPEMNNSLMETFTEEEVWSALESIGDLKAPGLDGMPALFYKKYWEVVGKDITKEVLHFLNGGDMPDGWNETCVMLIPKVDNPTSMKELRPISLCNVVY